MMKIPLKKHGPFSGSKFVHFRVGGHGSAEKSLRSREVFRKALQKLGRGDEGIDTGGVKMVDERDEKD